MKLGAEPTQIKILAGLLLFAAVAYFMGGDDRSKSASRVTPAVPLPAVPATGPRVVATSGKAAQPRPNNNRRTSQEFKPVLRPRRLEDRIDPTTIDPTLRNELLTRLSNVPILGGARPLFEFSAAPPPKAPDPGKIIPGKPVSLIKPLPGSMVPMAPVTPLAPAKPQAPPIPLKFYGFTSPRSGARPALKRAFFLENEDVFVANEGDVVKKRYKVVRINLNSVVMEDIEYKQQQTLPLTEQSQ